MPVIQCPLCDYATPDSSETIAVAVFNAHATSHMPSSTTPAQATPAAPRGPKLERPKVDIGVSLEEWNVFTRRLDAFVVGSGLDPNDYSAQLFQCAGVELGDAILKMDRNIVNGPTDTLLSTMKRLAVIAVAPGVLRSELMQMRQARDETFRTFAASVHGKAETCGYINESCTRKCDFTQSMVKDVLIAGIYDIEIRRDVLSMPDILGKTINDIISIVEAKETARNAMPLGSAAAMSTFKRNQRTAPPTTSENAPTSTNRSQTALCPQCEKSYALYMEGTTGWNMKLN